VEDDSFSSKAWMGLYMVDTHDTDIPYPFTVFFWLLSYSRRRLFVGRSIIGWAFSWSFCILASWAQYVRGFFFSLIAMCLYRYRWQYLKSRM
jgi:hypothetical protein